MSKIKRTLLAGLIMLMSVTMGVAVAACDNGPNVQLPDDDITDVIPEDSYVVSVASRGGYPLANVKVTFKKDGENKGEYFSGDAGKIAYKLDPDEYTLEVDESTLPKGYYVPAGSVFKTSATEKLTSIILDSRVIEEEAPENTVYRIGDVMYDFTFTDIDGVEHNLAETLRNKKAVMINFWGTTCNPCTSELPAIQKAYEAYSDKIEVFALSSYNNDTETRLINFRKSSDITYTFPMGLDTVEGTYIYRKFNVTGYPTTVIIDRYGVAATSTSGGDPSEAAWKALFNKFTSDNYSQEIINPDDEISFEWVPPASTEMVDSDDAINAAVSNGGSFHFYGDTEDENSWPFKLTDVEGKKVLSATNISCDHSYATLFFDVTLKAGEGLSFEYFIDTKSEKNLLYMYVDRTLVAYESGSSEAWLTQKIYVAHRNVTVQIALLYYKSNEVAVDTPCYIRNIKVYDAAKDGETVDFAYSATENATLKNGKYDVDVFEEDGLYYYNYTDSDGNPCKSILYADILDTTLWSDKHFENKTFGVTVEGNTYDYKASLYLLSFWKLSNINEESSEDNYRTTKFYYDEDDYIIINFYLQEFSPNGFIPVTPMLVEKINLFLDAVYEANLVTGERFEDEWLEFCLYFSHWGKTHKDCALDTNPVKGLTFEFAYDAVEFDEANPDNTTNNVDISLAINLTLVDHLEEAGGGLRYVFTPKHTGVYLFSSTYDVAQTDPYIIVFNSEMKVIAENDDDLRYNHFDVEGQINNFFVYAELTAGETYYITATMHTAGGTGTYSYTIKYVGDYVEMLRVCTTADGLWFPAVGEDGQLDFTKTYYGAVNAAYDKTFDCYRVVNSDYSYGSKIYIDFIRDGYYSEQNGGSVVYLSLADMLARQRFNNVNGTNYTNEMMEYYRKATAADRDKDDELYGMVEADERLVDILNDYMNMIYDDSPDAGAWLMFGCYYETYGTPAD